MIRPYSCTPTRSTRLYTLSLHDALPILLLFWIASHTQAREKQKQTTEVAAMVAQGAVTEWGPRVNLKGLKDLYAPQTVKPFTATPGGIDNLALSSTDSFLIPGKGEMKVDFK